MEYSTLDEITKTIIAVIDKAVNPPPPLPHTINVLPELLRNNINGVGFYLFHVQENSYYKNNPAPGNNTPPVNFTPMSLNLFYQLSPNWKEDDVGDAFQEQILMSAAMKALHDNAIITKKILPGTSPGGMDINIKITLQTLTPSESVQYWAAADSPVRLSAYYEVSVVFLEPEITTVYSGRVLKYGNYIFVRSAPQLISSENTIQYTVPGDPVIKQVTISPAQAPPNNGANSVITFTGTGFSSNSQLLLISSTLPAPALADTSWAITVINEVKLTATVQEKAKRKDTLAPVDIIPGQYAAQVIVTEVRTLPGLGTKTFEHSSNLFPVSILPRLDPISPGAGVGGDPFQITGYLKILSDDVQIYVGEESLFFVSGGGAIGAGQFNVTTPTTLSFKAPSTLPKGLVPIRVLINGVESPPQWITGL